MRISAPLAIQCQNIAFGQIRRRHDARRKIFESAVNADRLANDCVVYRQPLGHFGAGRVALTFWTHFQLAHVVAISALVALECPTTRPAFFSTPRAVASCTALLETPSICPAPQPSRADHPPCPHPPLASTGRAHPILNSRVALEWRMPEIAAPDIPIDSFCAWRRA
jgi:hypothetical protein